MLHGNFPFEYFTFPAGEPHVRVTAVLPPVLELSWFYDSMKELFVLALICDALKNRGRELDHLQIGYLPCSRQDRVAVTGDAFSLRVVADFINSLNIRDILLDDPHSYVAPALIRNARVREQVDLLMTPIVETLHETFADLREVYIVAPDVGAEKKAYEFVKRMPSTCGHVGFLTATKVRDPSDGKITGTRIQVPDTDGALFILVDDICDGGRTFTEIAKEIKKQMPSATIYLFVTHGLFTKGMEPFEDFAGVYSHNKGWVKR